MRINDMHNSPELKKAAVTFATGYAKRMMEGQYTRLMQTAAGKRAAELSRPSKYAVEVVLNGIVAYLSTKEGAIANTPIKEFLWEIAKDAPSEISKRLLNGDQPRAADHAIDVEASVEDKQTVLDGLLHMEADNLSAFLSWLEKTSPEDRRQMAETMAKLTEDEQRKLLALTPEQARSLFLSASPPQQAKPPKREGAIKSVTSALRELNESLEKRKTSS